MKRKKLKRPVISVIGLILGCFIVSASFIDYGLPNAGPGKPGQAISSLVAGIMILGGLPTFISHFFGKDEDDSVKPGDWSGD